MARYECNERTGVKTVSKMKADLLALMKKDDEIVIDLTAVPRIDLSVAQLVIATQKEGKKRGIQVRLAGASSDVKQQLMLCGVIKRGGAV
jgi:anti-anti-sigma regulatory factor